MRSRLPEGFRYSSDTNEHWLTRRELEELVTPETSAAEPVPTSRRSMSALPTKLETLAIHGGMPVREKLVAVRAPKPG